MFGGALLVWLFNTLSAVIRGTGNMVLPAYVTVGSRVAATAVPLLILGGARYRPCIAGAPLRCWLYYLAGSAVLAALPWSSRSLLRPCCAACSYGWAPFADICVGLGTVSTVATNLAIGITTALVGAYGTAAIAGYGTASRLEYLLVPLVFGLAHPGGHGRHLASAPVSANAPCAPPGLVRLLHSAMTEAIGLGLRRIRQPGCRCSIRSPP